MTLSTLLLGYVPVALLFIGANWYLSGKTLTRRSAVASAAEALVFTLFAALWFASLGAGGWVWIFGLLGVLIAGAERSQRIALLRSQSRDEVAGFVGGVVKYLAAGGLLAYLTAP